MLLVISCTIEDSKDVFSETIQIEPDEWPYPKVEKFVRNIPGFERSHSVKIQRLSDPTDPMLVYQLFFPGYPDRNMLVAQFHVENPSGVASSWGEFANYIITNADRLPAYVIATMVTARHPTCEYTYEKVDEMEKMILEAYESGDMMQ